MELIVVIGFAAVIILLIRLEWRLSKLDERFRVIGSALTSRQGRLRRAYRTESTPDIERARTVRRDTKDLPEVVRIGNVKRVRAHDRADPDS